MKVLGRIIAEVLYATIGMVVVIGGLMYFTNGSLNCTKTFMKNYYTCTATAIIPSR